MLLRSRAKTYLQQALKRGAINNAYQIRSYQSTAAIKSVEELLQDRNAVLTLPTGTGKTVICGMAAALFLTERPDSRVLFTAPRRALLSQLHDRSRWLNPTFPIRLVGANPREDGRHVRASFDYARIVFGMPEFLSNRLGDGTLDDAIASQVGLVIVDEFDHFLTLRYLARNVAVNFHDALNGLLDQLPQHCRLLLVSATTPELAEVDIAADVETQVDATAQAAFRRFLDAGLEPAYVSIPERYYVDFIPHAEIIAVAIDDPDVRALDEAIDEEIGLMLNWISGALGFPIDPVYVLPRLSQIRSGQLPLSPGFPRRFSDNVSGLLGRLQWLSHLADFLYEDMARDTGWQFEETFRWDRELESRIPATVRRIIDPPREGDVIPMHAQLRGKADGLYRILDRHPCESGVIFFRNIRILDRFAEELRAEGRTIVVVNGSQSPADNDRALARFRAGTNVLLLITRDTGKRGLDLPEADFAVFYSPKSREDVTWQEVSRIRSTLRDKKNTYILFYAETGEQTKMATMITALERTSHSKDIRTVPLADLGNVPSRAVVIEAVAEAGDPLVSKLITAARRRSSTST
ncbi:DEAD/DEAH box helicase [Rhizobium sp. 768_B6_N1_8]|uniref:DEAD/DEAH box helicase n=1 Tax=unclassified Rhizobium TaxID=2613769 RepID=UPI003F20D487